MRTESTRWNSTASISRAAEYRDQTTSMATQALAVSDWEIYAHTVPLMLGFHEPASIEWMAEFILTSSSIETLLTAAEHFWEWDPEPALSELRMPILAIHRRNCRAVRAELAQRTVARLPNAQLASLEGDEMLPWIGELDTLFGVLDPFLGHESASAARCRTTTP